MPLWYVSDLARIWFSAQALRILRGATGTIRTVHLRGRMLTLRRYGGHDPSLVSVNSLVEGEPPGTVKGGLPSEARAAKAASEGWWT